MQRIDLKDILRRTVSDDFGDLVTRRTGQAVRQAIEQELAEEADGQPAAIDFATVRLLDLSCADEIVGRLLREQGGARPFVLLNVTESQRDAIAFVLERHRLAVVVQEAGGALNVVGEVPKDARRAFDALVETGMGDSETIARRLDLSPEAARDALESLRQRRLVVASAGTYRAPVV